MNKIKKTIFASFILLSFFGCVSISFAAISEYTPLAPISVSGVTKATDLPGYLQNLFLIGIALAGAMAVFMIVLGGVQYMSTDSISGTNKGRERIQNALEGLLLVILCWVIMYTINPKLVGLNFNASNSIKNNDSYYISGTYSPTTKTYTTLDECNKKRDERIEDIKQIKNSTETNYNNNISKCDEIKGEQYSITATNKKTGVVSKLPGQYSNYSNKNDCEKGIQDFIKSVITLNPNNYDFKCQSVIQGYSYTETESYNADTYYNTEQDCKKMADKINKSGGQVSCLKKN